MPTDIESILPTVKGFHVTDGMMPADSQRAAARYVQLVQEIGRELGHKRGWKSEAARRLSIDQSYLSRLLSKDRVSVGLDIIQKAIVRLRLHHDFFYGSREPLTYRDYVLRSEPRYAGWAEFLQTELGRSMSADEKATLASVKFNGEPTVDLYQGWLLHMRGKIRVPDSAAHALNAALDDMIDSQGGARLDDNPEDD